MGGMHPPMDCPPPDSPGHEECMADMHILQIDKKYKLSSEKNIKASAGPMDGGVSGYPEASAGPMDGGVSGYPEASAGPMDGGVSGYPEASAGPMDGGVSGYPEASAGPMDGGVSGYPEAMEDGAFLTEEYKETFSAE